MQELTFSDLVLVLLAERKPRRHDRNLELFRILFERDDHMWTLRFNFLTSLGIALIIGYVSALLTGSHFFYSYIAIFSTIASLLLVAVFMVIVGRRHSRLRREYMDIIRIYYQLDRILP